MPIVDADTHVLEPARAWDFMEPSEQKFRPWSPLQGETMFFGFGWVVDGRLFPRRLTPQGQQTENEVPDGTADLTNLDARLRHMDELGVDIQVIYPTLFIAPVTENPELELALTRSYNRWLASVWKHSNRFRWVIVPPLRTIDAAVAELEYGKEHGACGVMFRGTEGERFANDPYFFPVYEKAQELDMPICFHSGNGNYLLEEIYFKDRDQPRFMSNVLPILGAFHHIVHGDLPKQFPKLRWGFVEAGAQWVPYMVREEARRLERIGRPISKDAIREFNIYITARTDDDLPYILQYTGEDNIIIGTDYGHKDVASEIAALQMLREDGGIPAHVVDKILDDNARRFYAL